MSERAARAVTGLAAFAFLLALVALVASLALDSRTLFVAVGVLAAAAVVAGWIGHAQGEPGGGIMAAGALALLLLWVALAVAD